MLKTILISVGYADFATNKTDLNIVSGKFKKTLAFTILCMNYLNLHIRLILIELHFYKMF